MDHVGRFERLFQPGRIGTLEIKNRIIMSPMGTGFADLDGGFSQRQIDWYSARARGGAGLIEVEGTPVEKEICTAPPAPVPCLDSPVKIPRAFELTNAVHDYGAKVSIQLSLGAGRNTPGAAPDRVPVSSSAIPAFFNPDILCRPLSVDEIKKLVLAFADASERAMMAGFDMISIHNHSGYLLDQFMSPLWNQRNDEYGGDFDGRMRLPLELIHAVRERVGDDFPIGFRIGIDLKLEGARTREEGLKICRRLESEGVDVLNIDQGCYDSLPISIAPCYLPAGLWLEDAAAVRNAVGVPVITSCNTYRPEAAEDALRNGKTDFVLMGRPLIADPDLPEKARQGKAQGIRPCTRCNEDCISGAMLYLRGLACQVNPTAGRERHYALSSSPTPKQVLVVGGGPAGMEAARVAAARGHDVTLWEQASALGGQMRAGSLFPFRSELADLIAYFTYELRRLGVQLHLSEKATLDSIKAENPDAVVLAAGAVPAIPQIPGATDEKIVSAFEFMIQGRPAGNSVLVAGGGMIGCEIALFLAQQGKRVSLVETLPPAYDINLINRLSLLELLMEHEVRIVNATVEEFNPEGTRLRDLDGKDLFMEADTVILALGGRSRSDLEQELRDHFDDLHVVGDCVSPRNIGRAIHEGFVAGWRI